MLMVIIHSQAFVPLKEVQPSLTSCIVNMGFNIRINPSLHHRGSGRKVVLYSNVQYHGQLNKHLKLQFLYKYCVLNLSCMYLCVSDIFLKTCLFGFKNSQQEVVLRQTAFLVSCSAEIH